MRLHTDTLTDVDVYDAARIAGIDVEHLTRHGSRSRDHAFEVAFAGSSNYGGQYGGLDYAAATWDEWGIALGVLFDHDPRLIAGGPNGYVGAVDYHWQTGHRFDRGTVLGRPVPGAPRVLAPAEQHKRHRWTYDRGEAVTGSYAVHACRCGAVRRFLLRGTTRAELGLDVPALADA